MSDVYKALSHPVRRRIIALLRERARSAGEIAEAFDLSKPTLSGHFNVLKAANLITDERKGTTLIYRVNVSVLEDAVAGLMDLFKIGEGRAPASTRTAAASPTAHSPTAMAQPEKEKS